MERAGKHTPRRVFREDVKEYLLDAILDGTLQPGDRVVESRIAKELGVSQGPVREALRDLELLGFIESEPFRGARVRKITAEDLIEIYPIRAALEGVAAREAARRIDDDTLQRLNDCLERMRQAASNKDRDAHIDADVQFHRTIVEASQNRMLLQMWLSTSLSSSTMVSVALTQRSLMELANRHVDIIDALRKGDPALAEATMRSHIEDLAQWISTKVEDDDVNAAIATSLATRQEQVGQ